MIAMQRAAISSEEEDMTATKHRLRHGLALAMVVGAFAAPSASAAPAEQFIPVGAGDQSSGQPTEVQTAPAPVVDVSSESGIDWGDAALGATGALAVLTIAAGVAVATRHRPHRRHTVA